MINKNGKIAIAQILVLVIGIVAFNFQLGGTRGAEITESECITKGGICNNQDYPNCPTGEKSISDCKKPNTAVMGVCCIKETATTKYDEKNYQDSIYFKAYKEGTTALLNKKEGVNIPNPYSNFGGADYNNEKYRKYLGWKEGYGVSDFKTATTTWNVDNYQDSPEYKQGYTKGKTDFTGPVGYNPPDKGEEKFQNPKYREWAGYVDGWRDTRDAKKKETTATTAPKTARDCQKNTQWKQLYNEGVSDGTSDAVAGIDRNPNPYNFANSNTPSLYCKEIGYFNGWDSENNYLTAKQQPSIIGSLPELVSAGGGAVSAAQGAQRVYNTITGGTNAAASAGTSGQAWAGAEGLPEYAGSTTAKAIVAKTGFWSATGYGQLIKNAGWATGIYLGLKTILPMVGASKSFSDAASKATGWGYFAGKETSWGLGKLGVAHASWIGFGVGTAIAITIFAISYKDTKTDKYIFNCEPWQANTGGSKCEECNKQGVLGCNEYQCRSLGQSCEIINAGTSEEKCAWVNKNDVKAPEIKVSYDALLKDYTYNPTAAVSPPDRGVKIEYNSGDKCVPAFTAFTFGINTNEPARCKIDYQRKNNFDDMSFYFGGSNYLVYNHTQFMSLPGSASLGEANLSLTGAGNYDLYVKCQDSNGNTNSADFVFKFCVDKGPDATAPLVVTTSIPSGNPVQFGTQKTELEVYTNEPAKCKWSIRDQDYSTMENEMLCAANAENMNTAMLYTCETILTDLQNKEDNTFYFRCQDTSPQKNTNTESYKFTLKGSQELVIDSVGPTNKTIKGSTESVPVTLTAKTSFGFNEGVATCQYSETDEAEKYVDFFETHSYTHSQVLVLKQGTYKYYIKCFDIAGNSDIETVSFAVEADPYAPVITRIYREDKNLKLITNKEASCVYTTFGCSYDMKDGTKIATSDGRIHLIGWETRTQFYIKCTDESKNKPLANECSVIVKPLDI